MAVLVLNSGSSSVKFALYERTPGLQSSLICLCSGTVNHIGRHTSIDGRGLDLETEPRPSIRTHEDAVRWITGQARRHSIEAVGHRVVHGGPWFTQTRIVDDTVMGRLEDLVRLAPLHNAVSLADMRLVKSLLGERVPMVTVFDTTFHRTIPDYAATYAIPFGWTARHAIRRYGFHGLAHASSAALYTAHHGSSPNGINLITMHLGNGCSVAAIRGGRSMDTSMGFTPLEGLVMGTRCGDIDPTIVSFLAEQENLSHKEVERILNQDSGLLGLSGLSSDMAELIRAERDGHEGARLAIDVFCYRVRKYVGAYLAVLGRVDALLFGGGIGQHAPDIRDRICRDMQWCGVQLSAEANSRMNPLPRGEIACISREGGILPVYVVAIDEEAEIARETVACLDSARKRES